MRLKKGAILILLLIAILLPIALPLTAAEKITIPQEKTKAVVLNEYNPEIPYGPLHLYVGGFESDKGLQRARILLKFDLSNIQNYVKSAILQINVELTKGFATKLPYEIELHKVTRNWINPGWSEQPSFEPTETASTTLLGNGTYNMDITETVREWLAAGSNFGLLLRGRDETQLNMKQIDTVSLIVVTDDSRAVETAPPILTKPIEKPMKTGLTGDFDGNGCVDFKDFLLFRSAVGTGNGKYNLDGAGLVDNRDYEIFKRHFNEGCFELFDQEMQKHRPSEPELKGNSDGNGCVDFKDFLLFAEQFNKDVTNENQIYDLDKDGDIKFSDFLIFAKSFNKECDSGKITIFSKINGPLVPSEYLDFQQEDELFLYSSFERNNDGNYLIYLLTTPNANPSKLVINKYSLEEEAEENFFRVYNWEFLENTDNFFDKRLPFNKIGKLYFAEVDPKNWPLGHYRFLEAEIKDSDIETSENFFQLASKAQGGLSGIGIYANVINPKDYDISSPCVPLALNGDSKDKIDIIFVPDKYDNSEFGKFEFAVHVNTAIIEMLKEPTFMKYENEINFYRINDFSYNTDCRQDRCNPDSYSSDRRVCCNEPEVFKASELCNSDSNLIHVFTQTEVTGGRGGTAVPIESRDEYPLLNLKYDVAGKNSKGWDVQTGGFEYRVPLHEMGHVVAALPDYYREYEDGGKYENEPLCKYHECMMCSHHYDFSNEGLCYDKQAIVEYLNQWCDVKNVEISKRNPTSPYPNPFNPTRSQTTNIHFKVDYEILQEPCFALMKVYNSNGIWVDFLVSENSVEEEFTFVWDGKTVDGKFLPSGTYIYEISIGNKKDRTSGTLLK